MVWDHGIYRSNDGGRTWKEFNDGLDHEGVYTLELDTEKGILYAGTRGGGAYRRKVDRRPA